jgi:hypothetical protein
MSVSNKQYTPAKIEVQILIVIHIPHLRSFTLFDKHGIWIETRSGASYASWETHD